MNKNDQAIAVFNAIIQCRAITGRNPNMNELKAVLPADLAVLPALLELEVWHWIAWDGEDVECLQITRPTEVRHDRAVVVDIFQRVESISRRWERKERRHKVTEMYQKKRPVETPEQKLQRLRGSIKPFKG